MIPDLLIALPCELIMAPEMVGGAADITKLIPFNKIFDADSDKLLKMLTKSLGKGKESRISA